MSVTSIWIQSHIGRVIYFNKQGTESFWLYLLCTLEGVLGQFLLELGPNAPLLMCC